jgi:hypothetical protein
MDENFEQMVLKSIYFSITSTGNERKKNIEILQHLNEIKSMNGD